MSNTNDQLSPRELYLIESYKEQTAAWRHENNLLYRFTTIVLPVSIAALGVPYVQADVPDLLATLGGLMLMTFWAVSCQIMQIKSNLRFSIINKIEKSWGIPSPQRLQSDKGEDIWGGSKQSASKSFPSMLHILDIFSYSCGTNIV